MTSYSELFAGVDEIGSKYQAAEERNAFRVALRNALGDVDALIEEYEEKESAIADESADMPL
jgi:hypothetical protein